MLGEKHHLEVYEKRRLETAEKAKETSAHSQAALLKFAKLYKNLTVEERDDFLFSDDCPKYRKIPKLSPGAYIFQRPFLRGLFLKGLIFGRAYIWREVCVSKSARLILEGTFASQIRLG